MSQVDLRWLRLLVALEEHGTLRAAADVTGYSTSAVSQQLAALQTALDATLVEPAGRRLQLTPAGRALLPYARTVLATMDAAQGALGSSGEPVGLVRVAGFASALAARVIPAVPALRQAFPRMSVAAQEREPAEVAALLAEDGTDVGLVYEYSLVPRAGRGTPFGQVEMALVVPEHETRGLAELLADPATMWISNSRAPDDDELIDRVGAHYGARPEVVHRIDSLHLLTDVVRAGLGVSLIAADGPQPEGVRYIGLDGAAGVRTGYALTRPGRERWPANAALIASIAASITAGNR